MAKNILSLNAKAAKEFFMGQEAYVNIELPPYFSFREVIAEIDDFMTGTPLVLDDLKGAKKSENVNHVLYGNKDGKYAWRKFQLINPLIYVSLVNLLTITDNWKYIQDRFEIFQGLKNIRCESLPIIPRGKRKQRAAQISQWINNIEKKSISLSLEYKFLYHTDIRDCYGSIYTHSISWALHDKAKAKAQRKPDSLLGNRIDCHLQAMANGQTNGIPEGSSLMDLMAEIVLGYADYELSEKLNSKLKGKEWYILRYRDDYRIFVNDLSDADIIVKALTEILLDLGFRLNTDKTSFNQDIVGASIKEDKLDSLKFELTPPKLSKSKLLRQLLIIQQIGKKFPNAGVVKNRLYKILNIAKPNNFKNQESTLTAILIDIAYDNPGSFPLVAGLISRFITNLQKREQKILLGKIHRKICALSNIGLLEIWMQRIALGLRTTLVFNEKLCSLAYGDNGQKIFDTDWIKDGNIKKIIDNGVYVDKAKLKAIKPKIGSAEIQIFSYEN